MSGRKLFNGKVAGAEHFVSCRACDLAFEIAYWQEKGFEIIAVKKLNDFYNVYYRKDK